MTSIVGSGNKDLAILALRLKAAGEGGLRRELLAGIRGGATPILPAVREAALAQLPKRGGLNEWVAASKFTIRNRLSPFTAGVSIVNQPIADTSRRGSGSVQFGTDKGRVRHPVFGHRDRKWAETTVANGGWFTGTIERHLPQVTADVTAVITKVAADLAGRVS